MGRILTVPVTKGAVIMAGEPVATIGGGGFFLRLAIPERHAALLSRTLTVRIGGRYGAGEGHGPAGQDLPADRERPGHRRRRGRSGSTPPISSMRASSWVPVGDAAGDPLRAGERPPSPRARASISCAVARTPDARLHHSPLTPLFLLAALAFGLVALLTLPREEEPQISVPMVDIHVRADGLKAEDAVKLVTEPLETIVKSIDGVEHVYSQTPRRQRDGHRALPRRHLVRRRGPARA
jgi:hypothetical protein